VRAKYDPTPRNEPCLEFLKRAGFPAREGENVFIWYADEDYPMPEVVECSKKVGREVNQRGRGDHLG
jgi:hypothetical protein